MKPLFLLILVILAGCRSVPAPTPLPSASVRAPQLRPVALPPPPVAIPSTSPLELKVRQQAQFIDALLSQNEALTAKLATVPPLPSTVPPVPVALPVLAPAPMPPPVPPPAPAPNASTDLVLAPNSDGVIDLAAGTGVKPGEPVNPFALRSVPPEAVREVTVHVGGIIAGPTACAIVNDRLVQRGDLVESLPIERIDSDAVYLRHDGRRLRLPVAVKPVRVRLPL